MKIQVHNNELRPLVKHSYEKVYDQLSKLLAAEEFIFAKWEAGFGDVLQWTLPNDLKWINLTLADSFDRNAVIAEFLRIKERGAAKLGNNRQLIENIYSVPSENFVYYTIDQHGSYHVMLTGWGYAYPRMAPIAELIGAADPASQPVYVRFIENGQPMSALRFDIPRQDNHTVRLTADHNGELYIGALKPGESIPITIPSPAKELSLTVVKGKQFYTFDLTELPEIKIPEIVEEDVPEEVEDVADESAADETPERNRDISIRFIGTNGRPVSDIDAEFTQSGHNSLIEHTGNDGSVWLDKNDFMPGAPITIQLHGPGNYDPIPFALDMTENQYEIVFREIHKSNVWLTILLIFGAAAATVGAWLLFATIARSI